MFSSSWYGKLLYWNEVGLDSVALLLKTAESLQRDRRRCSTGDGFKQWDLEVNDSPWSNVRVRTVTENHGGQKRLIRIAFQWAPTRLAMMTLFFSLPLVGAFYLLNISVLQGPMIAITLAEAIFFQFEEIRHARKTRASIDEHARQLKLIPLPKS